MKKLLGELELNKIYHMDCLEGMKLIPDKSVDLIVIDPPYNIGKAEWDNWETIEEYIEFMGKVFKECERVLKDNGSFYFFHNDFLQIVELQNWLNKNSGFIFKNIITWDKLENADAVQIGTAIKLYGKQRSYFKGFTEYLLFYTKQDTDIVLLKQRDYLLNEWKRSGLKISDIKKLCGFKGNQPYNWFSPKNCGNGTWQLPKEEHYKKLQSTGFWQKPYEELKNELNESKYKFNQPKINFNVKLEKQKDNLRNFSCNWNFARPKENYLNGHLTPKPIEMIEHIIKVSSNENDIVLDCFMGSGTTAIAATLTNRKWIGFELVPEYIEIANKRLEQIHNELNDYK